MYLIACRQVLGYGAGFSGCQKKVKRHGIDLSVKNLTHKTDKPECEICELTNQ
jgi:hypothetical protein